MVHLEMCNTVYDNKADPKINLSESIDDDYNNDDPIFDFSDNYFRDDLNLDVSVDIISEGWLELLNKYVESHNGFKVLHLNDNSFFNKFEHILNILDSGKLDIIALNEVKLDENVPNKLYEHPGYTMKRRDRNMHVGGFMVYIRKCYKIMQFSSSSDNDIFSFKLKINKIESSFVCGYKPPINNN
jgi:hypothetical protein